MTVPGALALSAPFLLTTRPLRAQLISIKTVPIAQGDQFNVFPSLNQGMGGVAIGLPDTLLDPFRNPAKGGRLSIARFFGSPMVYGVSNNAGGGRTLPVAAIAPLGSWFGALSLAVQEVDPSRPPESVLMGPPPPGVMGRGPRTTTPGGGGTRSASHRRDAARARVTRQCLRLRPRWHDATEAEGVAGGELLLGAAQRHGRRRPPLPRQSEHQPVRARGGRAGGTGQGMGRRPHARRGRAP